MFIYTEILLQEMEMVLFRLQEMVYYGRLHRVHLNCDKSLVRTFITSYFTIRHYFLHVKNTRGIFACNVYICM
jgi:hypothetical protein